LLAHNVKNPSFHLLQTFFLPSSNTALSEVITLLKAAEKPDSWWERANKKLEGTSLKTRFTLNSDGRVEVNPAVLPADYEETRLLFEIVDDVFSMLEEEAEEAELDQPDS
jgi:hypothetical protein